jgi:hypothetical protein
MLLHRNVFILFQLGHDELRLLETGADAQKSVELSRVELSCVGKHELCSEEVDLKLISGHTVYLSMVLTS